MDWGSASSWLTDPAVAGWVVTVAAAVAAATWADRASHPEPFGRREVRSVTGWAVLSTVGHLLWVARLNGAASEYDPLLVAVGWVVSTTAAVLVVLAVAEATRRVVLAGRLLPVVVDSTVVGVGAVTVLWGLTGAGRGHLDVARPLTTAVVAATLLTLVLRARAVSPSLVVDGRFHAALGWGAVAAGAMAVSGWSAVLGGARGDRVAVVASVLGYLAAAAAAVVARPRPRPAGPARRAGLSERLAPSLVAAVAILALVLRAGWPAAGGVDVVGAVLGGALLASLLASQVLTARENDQLTAELSYSRARLAAMAANSGDVIVGLDETGRVIAVNDAARTLLSRPPEALVGTDVVALADVEDRIDVRAAVLDVVQGIRDEARTEFTLADPGTGTVELRLRRVPGGAVANLSDVTESVELRERLVAMTRFDQMTGLANRSHLVSELGQWLDAGVGVAVLYVDLDGFKAVNDRFGHAAGDAVLVEVAQRLMRVATSQPADSLVARSGGDEFVIALRGMTMQQAMSAGDAVLVAIRPTFSVADRAVRLGASVGVAATDDGSRQRETDDTSSSSAEGTAAQTGAAAGLLHRADIAMFAAKESGRFRVRHWEARLEEAARRRVDIAIGLRRALETGRLALAYQPIVRLADGVIVGAEALIRLPRSGPEDVGGTDPGSLAGLAGLVSPAELVEVAEGTGEIDALGRWVLAEATHQAALWQRMRHRVRVTVNMSVRQLSDPTFDQAVLHALRAARLPADRLVIEITEGQLLGEGDQAHETITTLRGHGVQLAIDDFGSGYSSLSYLRRMPVTTVKIDRTLLAGVGSDDRATTVVRAVIGAARGLGLQVVCEGIESLALARMVRDLGAWAGQGFALYQALTPEALRDVLDGPPVSLVDDARRSGPNVSHSETASTVD